MFGCADGNPDFGPAILGLDGVIRQERQEKLAVADAVIYFPAPVGSQGNTLSVDPYLVSPFPERIADGHHFIRMCIVSVTDEDRQTFQVRFRGNCGLFTVIENVLRDHRTIFEPIAFLSGSRGGQCEGFGRPSY